MAKIALYKIEENGERTEKKLDESKVAMLPELIKRGWKRVGIIPEAPPAAPTAPAAVAAPAAPAPAAEEGSLWRDLSAAATGFGRGFTADFLDEIAGLAAAAGGQIGGRLAGVDPELLAQEDFYTQGREEEQARQKKLQEESPWLTAAGQIPGAMLTGSVLGRFVGGGPTISMSPGVTAASQFAQAAPAAAAYGAMSGVGRTDVKSPEAGRELGTEQGPSADVPTALLGNVALDAGLGVAGAGLGAAAGAGASAARARLARMLTEIGDEADAARVAQAGPGALKEAQKGQGGVDVKEAARVMRARNLGGLTTPGRLLKKAKSEQEDAGALIRRIIGEVDQQSAGLMKQLDDAEQAFASAQDDIQTKLADKAKAAEVAAKSADEIEASLAAAEKRFLEESAELRRAASGSGVPAPRKATREPLVMIDESSALAAEEKAAAEQAEAAAKEASLAADALAAQAKRAMDEILAPRAGLVDQSEWRSAMTRAIQMKSQADAATSEAARLTQEAARRTSALGKGTVIPSPATPEPLSMRSVVSAQKSLNARQKDIDMMRATAQKSREEATRLAQEALPAPPQQATLDALRARIDKLTEEVSKRKVSGDEVAKRLEREAADILKSQNRKPEQLAAVDKAKYDALLDAAERNKGLQLSLRETQASLPGLARAAQFKKGADEAVSGGRALAAREESRGLRSGMDAAVEAAIPATSPSDIVTSPLATVGRGGPVTGPVTGRDAYGSARRVYDVMEDIVPSAEKEAARIRSMGFMSPTGAMEAVAPGLRTVGLEGARSLGEFVRPAMPMMSRPPAAPYGAETFADMIRRIDEEAQQ